jgi:hypothetical protein
MAAATEGTRRADSSQPAQLRFEKIEIDRFGEELQRSGFSRVPAAFFASSPEPAKCST